MKSKKEEIISEKIKLRGKIQLIAFEKFFKEYPIKPNKMTEVESYKNENNIIKIYEKNINSSNYFNVIFFNYEEIEDAANFLKLFVQTANDNGNVKNNSDYPFFVFFRNNNFTKEKLYTYYLEISQEMDILPYYELKSYNIFVIKKSIDEINNLLTHDITNYFYEFDFKDEHNPYQIQILFMGTTGCGKSTFINRLLGKLRAYSSSANNLKSIGGVYSHSKYPICITDSEGFEVNSESQQNKIFEILNKNIESELSHRTHIAFYLIPGPFNSNRDLDYSCLGSLIKLEQYNIYYYLVMTKDPYECKNFAKTSLRFLTGIINNRDFSRIKRDNLNDQELIKILEQIKAKLEKRILSVDVTLRESKQMKNLFNQIHLDLLDEKNKNVAFITDLEKNKKDSGNVEIDISGSSIFNDKRFTIPPFLEKSPFFNLSKLDNDPERRRKAKKIIEEAKDVSSIRKIFFCYNSKMKENRRKMLKEILKIYECPNLTIQLIEDKFSDKEKNEWFYLPECTDDLGNKIINICQEEYKKLSIVDRFVNYSKNFVKSIDEFGKYKEEFLNFKINGQIFPYDSEYKV